MKLTLTATLLLLQVLLGRLSVTLHHQPHSAIVRHPAATTTVVYSPPEVVRPEITSITPSHGPTGTLITVKGRGFATTSNTVYTSYDVLEGLPSPDGETLTLKVEPPGLPPNLGALKTADFPELRFRFYVKNQNGTTLAPGEFVLDL